jgi:hypothetical protein
MAETLDFVLECGRTWNVNNVWLEYSPNGEKQRKFRVVDHQTASRGGERASPAQSHCPQPTRRPNGSRRSKFFRRKCERAAQSPVWCPPITTSDAMAVALSSANCEFASARELARSAAYFTGEWMSAVASSEIRECHATVLTENNDFKEFRPLIAWSVLRST